LQASGAQARHGTMPLPGVTRAPPTRFGVHIIQNCEVTGFELAAGQVAAVKTSRGTIRAERFGMAVAGSSSAVAKLAGFELPIQSYTLQAMVSEPVKPCLDTIVLSSTNGVYVSQSDKGELVFGGNLDRCPSYMQRGSFRVNQSVIAPLVEMFPAFATLKLMRQWGGVRRHDARQLADHRPVASARTLPQLRLGNRWFQGDSRWGNAVCACACDRAASSAVGAVRFVALREWRNHRRSACWRGALGMTCTTHKSSSCNKLPSFPRKRESILTLLASQLHEKSNLDSRFRGNDGI
jgi:heterotetrameric sarcosine oxidase beta subunit